MPDSRNKQSKLLIIRKVFLRRLIWTAVASVFLTLAYHQIGNKVLLPIARNQIAELTGTEVTIGSIEFKLNGFVRINSISVGPADKDVYNSAIFGARQMDMYFSIPSVLLFKPAVKRIVLDEMVANVFYDVDEKRWNLAALDFSGSSQQDRPLPVINTKSGILKISKIENQITRPLAVVGVNGVFAPIKGYQDSYSFYFGADDSLGFGGSELRGIWRAGTSGTILMSGKVLMNRSPVYHNTWDLNDIALSINYDEDNISVTSLKWKMADDFAVDISGKLSNYRTDPGFELDIFFENAYCTDVPTADSFVYSKALLEKCGPAVSQFFDLYNPKGFVDVTMNVKGRMNDLPGTVFDGTITCNDISVLYEKFQYRVDKMTGSIDISNSGAILNDLKCKHGEVDINISGFAKGSEPDIDCEIEITSPNMLIEDDLYRALDSKQKELWWIFTPSGSAKIKYSLKRSPSLPPEQNLTIDLVDVQAVYKHFPYPLKNLQGRVVIEPDRLTIEKISSRYQGKEISLEGTIADTDTDRPRYNMVITANNIPIDNTLKMAMPETQKEFYNNFDVDAIANVEVTVFPNEVGRRLVEYIAKVNIRGSSLVYEEFPLPLRDINLDAVLTADKIILNKVQGNCGTGKLVLSGTVWPATAEKPEPGFCLTLDARQIELEENFIGALPKGPSAMLSQLQPAGKVNMLADININSRRPDCPQYKIEVECLGDDFNFKEFPYPLENVTGTVIITDNNIELKNIFASSAGPVAEGQVKSKISLNASLISDGLSVESGSFTIHASDIQLDDKLARAFAEIDNNIYSGLNPKGALDIDIENAKFYTNTQGEKQLDFASRIAFKDCSIGSNGMLTNMNAVLETKTSYMLGHGFLDVNAEFTAESLSVKNKTVENVSAGIQYDPEQSVFASKQLTADFYNGKLFGDVQLKYPDKDGVQYMTQMVFDNVDVTKVLAGADTLIGSSDDGPARGTANGSFSLAGIFDGSNRSKGRLNLEVSQMQLAKQSLLGKILATLQFTESTDYIFNGMTVDSYIKDDSVYFEEVYMYGKSLVMKGAGRLDLRENNVNLDFVSYAGQKNVEPTLLDSLARGLGQAMVTVKVHGNIENPEIETTPLPLLKSPIDLLGNKL
jgi:hypothetical protein